MGSYWVLSAWMTKNKKAYLKTKTKTKCISLFDYLVNLHCTLHIEYWTLCTYAFEHSIQFLDNFNEWFAICFWFRAFRLKCNYIIEISIKTRCQVIHYSFWLHIRRNIVFKRLLSMTLCQWRVLIFEWGRLFVALLCIILLCHCVFITFCIC